MSRSVFRTLATTRVIRRPPYDMYQHYRQRQCRLARTPGPRPNESTDHDCVIKLVAGVDRQWSQTESISKRLDALAIELKSELKGEIRTFYTKLKDDDIKLGKKLDRTIVWLVTLFLGAGAWKNYIFNEGMRQDIVEKTRGKVMQELSRGGVELIQLKGKIGEKSDKAAEVVNEKSEVAGGGQDKPPVV